MLSSDSTSFASNPLATSSSVTMGGKRSRRANKGSRMMSRAGSKVYGGKRRGKRGGQAYDSASSYGTFVNGSVNGQFARTFDNGHPTPYGNGPYGAQGQGTVIPASVASSGSLKGGKRRTKKGGYWSQVLSTALVPFGLWAAQNHYSKRRGLRAGGKTKKHRK